LSGSKLQNGTVDVTKLVYSGVPNNYVLAISGGVPDWIAPTTVPGVVTSKQVVEVALPAVGVPVDVITYAATGGRADIYQFFLRCTAAEHGFAIGDEVPLASLGNDDASNEAGPLIYLDASASKLVHVGPANYQIQDATAAGGTIVTPNRARWVLKCVAIRFA
jgi:hypothetical protein